MFSNTDETKRFFAQIDPNLPQAFLTAKIGEVFQSMLATDGDVILMEYDLTVLQHWAIDKRAEVRKVAIEVLCELGPLSWEDLKTWVFDPDADVRKTVLGMMDGPYWQPLKSLLATDPQRYMQLLGQATERYVDFASMWALTQLSLHTPYLEQAWLEINRLIDLAQQDINSTIQARYLEDVITEKDWGPDDPHLAPWIQGSDQPRQTLLLITASWIGLETAKYREITEALSHVQNPDIAELACEILAGTVRFSDANGWFVYVTASENS